MKFILTSIAVFIITYLLFSFYWITFNFALWSADGRGLYCFISVFIVYIRFMAIKMFSEK